MLHKTVYLVNLQVICPVRTPELSKVAGQLRNSFYEASFPWSEGNLGRVIPISVFETYHKEYEKLRTAFFDLCTADQKVQYKVTLTVIPFPSGESEALLEAPAWVSLGVDVRFTMRLCMLQEALEKEKKFYESLLTGLEEIIEIGLFLRKSIDPKVLDRLKRVKREVLRYSAEDVRNSTSVREELINVCGALI